MDTIGSIRFCAEKKIESRKIPVASCNLRGGDPMDFRKAMFRGSWYPDTAGECEREIRDFLKQEQDREDTQSVYSGGIVPHAGWYFSGAIACNVIERLSHGPKPDVLVVFGMHLPPGAQPVLMVEGAWETPFGELVVDTRITRELRHRFDFAEETPLKFTQDNTIELQLPFIQYFFKDTPIVTVGLPPGEDAHAIAKALVGIAGDLNLDLKVIGSTDLTHYGFNYGFTPRGVGQDALDWVRDENDGKVIEAILDMDPNRVMDEALRNQSACCPGAVVGAIEAVLELGATKAETLAYATSHDKSPGDNFVGYVGVLFR
jgi:MEMO1 family protein